MDTDGPLVASLSSSQYEVLQAAYHDVALRVQDGQILAVSSKVGLRGLEYVQAFRFLHVRDYLKWTGHSVTGGELYQITEGGRRAFEAAKTQR